MSPWTYCKVVATQGSKGCNFRVGLEANPQYQLTGGEAVCRFFGSEENKPMYCKPRSCVCVTAIGFGT